MAPRYWLRTALLTVLLVGTGIPAGVRGQDPPPPLPMPGMSAEFLVGVGNVLRLSVSGRDYGGDYVVEENGMVHLPNLGAVAVAGLPLPQVRDRLRDSYRQILRDPEVVVMVAAFFTVPVLGEVGLSGNFTLSAGATPLQAVAAASGFGPAADKGGTYILRGQQRVPLGATMEDQEGAEAAAASVAALASQVLQSGDAVVVPRRALSWLTAANLFAVAQLLLGVVTLIKVF